MKRFRDEDVFLDGKDPSKEDKTIRVTTEYETVKESDMKPTTNGNGKIRWKNRRRMAWLSLISIIGLMGLLLTDVIPVERIHALKEPITWFFFAAASIIGAYMGFTTWSSKK